MGMPSGELEQLLTQHGDAFFGGTSCGRLASLDLEAAGAAAAAARGSAAVTAAPAPPTAVEEKLPAPGIERGGSGLQTMRSIEDALPAVKKAKGGPELSMVSGIKKEIDRDALVGHKHK
jgi:hypothetical protein